LKRKLVFNGFELIESSHNFVPLVKVEVLLFEKLLKFSSSINIKILYASSMSQELENLGSRRKDNA